MTIYLHVGLSLSFVLPFMTRTQPILLQAQDEEDRKSWLEAMDGKEPVCLALFL